MSKIAVVYWSGTGNTQAMADAVAEGAKGAGAEVTVFGASEFNASKVAEFDAIVNKIRLTGIEKISNK